MMSNTMEKLSTGYRINDAGDDAAGLAIAAIMTNQIRGTNMAGRNASHAIAIVSVARFISIVSVALPSTSEASYKSKTAMDNTSFRNHCLDFCRVGKTLSETERDEAPKLCVILTVFLWDKARALVASSLDQPVLCSYQSDATSYLCKHVTVETKSNFHVVRHGKVLFGNLSGAWDSEDK